MGSTESFHDWKLPWQIGTYFRHGPHLVEHNGVPRSSIQKCGRPQRSSPLFRVSLEERSIIIVAKEDLRSVLQWPRCVGARSGLSSDSTSIVQPHKRERSSASISSRGSDRRRRKKKRSDAVGLEPTTFGSEAQCAIRCATRPRF